MSVSVGRVFEDALCLTEKGRILLAERLLESIPPDKSVLEAQTAVAVKRADEMDSGAVVGIFGVEGLHRVRESIEGRAGA